MYYPKLRAALKAAYPDQYSFLTWKSLLADFVQDHNQAYYLQRHRYEQDKLRNPDAVPPVIADVVKQAIILLARQQKRSYLFLALSHYLLSHETALLTVERDHYRELATRYEQLSENFKQLAGRAISQVGDADNL